MRRILFWVTIGISFLFLANWLVLSASGYRFNSESGRLVKTAYLRVKSEPRDVAVYLNGKLVASKTPLERKRLLPGSYDLKIEKPGFHSWDKTINLAQSQALVFPDVVLFRSNAQVELASEEDATFLQNLAKPDDLYFQDGEIFTAERLITRLSRDVLFANWYPNKNFIAYQVEGEIRIVEIDGSNDLKLAELQSKKPTLFFFADNGRYLVYKDGDELKRLKLL